MALKELIRYLQNYPGFILIGFGREGRSSYSFLRKSFNDRQIIIADKNNQLKNDPLIQQDPKLKLQSGENYLAGLPETYFILLSPGVKLTDELKKRDHLSSQTDLFLRFYRKQTIGITGTKGKSTTSALTSNILRMAAVDQVLLGNIGSPPFDHLHEIHKDTQVVFELSSHQLSTSRNSPAIAILLNLYNEHLDHYDSVHHYFSAKTNIFKYQDHEDAIICNADSQPIQKYLKTTPHKGKQYFFSVSGNEVDQGMYLHDDQIFSKLTHRKGSLLNLRDIKLRGKHNLLNIMAAACSALLLGIDPAKIRKAVTLFHGLEHRLEYVGLINGRHFYNDSIATVPEASIAAIRAIGNVSTLILGGYERELDYEELYSEILASAVNSVIFTGDAGKRMYNEIKLITNKKGLYYERNFKNAVVHAISLTPEEGVCLLSPAAASYDQFTSFEERGKIFKELVS